MRWKREKRSNILRIDILSQFFLYIQSDVFFHQMIMFSINKGKYLGKQKIVWKLIRWIVGCSYYPGGRDIIWLLCQFFSHKYVLDYTIKAKNVFLYNCDKYFFHTNNVVKKWLLLSNKNSHRDKHSQISNKQHISRFRLAQKREISKTQITTFLTSD